MENQKSKRFIVLRRTCPYLEGDKGMYQIERTLFTLEEAKKMASSIQDKEPLIAEIVSENVPDTLGP